MGKLSKVFLVFLLFSFVFAACAAPIGVLYIPYDPGTYDNFWVTVRREVYHFGDTFDKNNDLSVFASSDGMVSQIPVSEVTISLIRNPDSTAPNGPILIDVDEYRLVASVVGAGRKLIIVTFGNMTTSYSIEVFDPQSIDDPDNGDSTGIGIRWH